MEIFVFGVLRLVNKTFLLMSSSFFVTLFTFTVKNFSVINGTFSV